MTAHRQGLLRPPVNAVDHATGRVDAPLTLVEYGDFQCPHCREAYPIVLRLQEQLGERLRFVYRHFPLIELHPHAAHAAEAAESVAAQAGGTAFWAMHHSIFEHQRESPHALDDDHLVAYAARVGADPAQVRADLASGIHRTRVRTDFASGVRSGVNGTPTFFINGVRFEGDWSQPRGFEAALREAAREPEHSVP
jgi:protein-disulfide isomerase